MLDAINTHITQGPGLTSQVTIIGYACLVLPLLLTGAFITTRATSTHRRAHFPKRRNPTTRPARVRRVSHKIAYATTGAIVISVLIIWRIWAFGTFGATPSMILFLAGFLISVLFGIGYALGADKYSSHATIPNADIVAIIPSYNENDEDLHAAITAILSQTLPVNRIYVVDDGSTTPARPYNDPRVTWIRQTNAGKREAQAAAIQHLLHDRLTNADLPPELSRYSIPALIDALKTHNDPASHNLLTHAEQAGLLPDFILTIDSDSRISPTSVEECTRVFQRDDVYGVTGMIIVREPRNLISRLIDLDMVCGILTTRRARSSAGIALPCSGALSMYRTHILTRNLHDYVHSGTYSDDRRLAHYCLREGKVLGIDLAIVDTLMPDTIRGAWKQRVRWYKGYWFYLTTEIEELPTSALLMRWWSTITTIMFPLLIAWSVILPLVGKPFPWHPYVLWILLLYATGLLYFRRPQMRFSTRFLTWLLLTPLLPIFQLLLIKPSMYYAAWTVWRGGDSKHIWDGGRIETVQ